MYVPCCNARTEAWQIFIRLPASCHINDPTTLLRMPFDDHSPLPFPVFLLSYQARSEGQPLLAEDDLAGLMNKLTDTRPPGCQLLAFCLTPTVLKYLIAVGADDPAHHPSDVMHQLARQIEGPSDAKQDLLKELKQLVSADQLAYELAVLHHEPIRQKRVDHYAARPFSSCVMHLGDQLG